VKIAGAQPVVGLLTMVEPTARLAG